MHEAEKSLKTDRMTGKSGLETGGPGIRHRHTESPMTPCRPGTWRGDAVAKVTPVTDVYFSGHFSCLSHFGKGDDVLYT